VNAPQAVLLDLDGTLLDGSRLHQALELTCAAVGLELGIEPDPLRASNEAAFAAYWPSAERDWQIGRLAGATLAREVWTRALRALGVSSSGATERAVATHTAFTRNALRLFNDAPHFLNQLAGRVPLALVSNGAGDTQRERLG